MSIMSGPGSGGAPRPMSGDNDIYTALIFTAFLFVLIGTIFVAYRANEAFGGIFPAGGN